MPLLFSLNSHCQLQEYLITVSEIGILWQFRLGKFGVQFESEIFLFGPPININIIKRVGGGVLACHICQQQITVSHDFVLCNQNRTYSTTEDDLKNEIYINENHNI